MINKGFSEKIKLFKSWLNHYFFFWQFWQLFISSLNLLIRFFLNQNNVLRSCLLRPLSFSGSFYRNTGQNLSYPVSCSQSDLIIYFRVVLRKIDLKIDLEIHLLQNLFVIHFRININDTY